MPRLLNSRYLDMPKKFKGKKGRDKRNNSQPQHPGRVGFSPEMPSSRNNFVEMPQSSITSLLCSVPLSRLPGFIERIKYIDQNTPTDTKNFSETTKKLEAAYNGQLGIENVGKSNQKETNKILCLYCEKKFASKKLQMKHIARFHRELKERRSSQRNAKVDYIKQNRTSFCFSTFPGCVYCNVTTNTKETLSSRNLDELFVHLSEFHADRYFGCTACVQRFQSPEKLTKHMLSMHNETELSSRLALKTRRKCCSKKKIAANAEVKNLRQASAKYTPIGLTCASTANLNGLSQDANFTSQDSMLYRRRLLQTRPSRKLSASRLHKNADAEFSISPTLESNNGAIFRVPPRTDNSMAFTFDENFYHDIVLNVKMNMMNYIDGKLSESDNIIKTPPKCKGKFLKQTQPAFPVFSEPNVVIPATNCTRSSSKSLPTLLTVDQCSTDAFPAKIKRAHTKHSWKWKWDCSKKYKLVNEGGKTLKKAKHPTVGLRDLSKLDLWTQLTMRRKYEMYRHSSVLKGLTYNEDVHQGESQKRNVELNLLLDMRLLPQIILEQNEQAILKIENEEFGIFESSSKNDQSLEGQTFFDDNFLSVLELLPFRKSEETHAKSVLSGEWARPRCYLCMCCGEKFEKLKAVEEHKMFRHPHIFTTHYEVVGRELLAINLLNNLFIPKRALFRYGCEIRSNTDALLKQFWTKVRDENESPEEDSSDSVQSIKHIRVNHNQDCEDTLNPYAVSQIPNPRLSNYFISMFSKKETNAKSLCTKCNRKCNGFLDLYRHMLDCSGDYVWSLVKKRKYRYYGGSKKRRTSNRALFLDIRSIKQTKSNKPNHMSDVQETKLDNSGSKIPKKQRTNDDDPSETIPNKLPAQRTDQVKGFQRTNLKRCNRLSHPSKILTRLQHKKTKNSFLLKTRRKYKKITLNNKCGQIKKSKLAKRRGFPKNLSVNLKLQQINHKNSPVEEPETGKAVDETLLSVPSNSSANANISCNNEIGDLEFSRELRESEQRNGIHKSTSDVVIKKDAKKRCKKINDCIAMLTGKLSEKLRTEPAEESSTKSKLEEDCKKGVESKTPRKKSLSRRIIKATSSQIINVPCGLQGEPEMSATHYALLSQLNPPNLAPVSGCFWSNIIEKPSSAVGILAQAVPPTTAALIATVSPCLAVQDQTKDQIKLDNLSILSIKPPIGEPLNLCNLKPICVQNPLPCLADESVKSLNFTNDSLTLNTKDISSQPLDLSKKSGNDACKVNNLQNSVKPTMPCTKISPLPLESNKLLLPSDKANQFYTNLELLKIPQVPKPTSIYANDFSNVPPRNCTKSRKSDGSATSNGLPFNNTSMKPSPQKNKLSQEMDKTVLRHIDDVITSVINAVKEHVSDEEEKSPTETSVQDEQNKISVLAKDQNETIDTNSKANATGVCKEEPAKDNLDDIIVNRSDVMDNVEEPNACNGESDLAPIKHELPSLPNVPVNNTDIETEVRPVLHTEASADNLEENPKHPIEHQLPKDEPLKKQKRRRKNELAAIVADQLLESFKIDKARRDNLKKLENLAYEKSEDLFLTGMMLMSTTKRTASRAVYCNQSLSVNDSKKQKYSKTTPIISPSINSTEDLGKVGSENKEIEHPMETDNPSKRPKYRRFRERGKILANSNHCDVKSTKPFPKDSEIVGEEDNIEHQSSNACDLKGDLSNKNCILMENMEKGERNIGKRGFENKRSVSSRDPRLNKHIHKDNNLGHPGGSAKNNHFCSSKDNSVDGCDFEEDNYLTEIAKNVNDKISAESEEFAFVNDDFESVNNIQENSSYSFYRPSTSMSVRSAPNFRDDQDSFGYLGEENTNTDVMDMDLDDDLSIYTTVSQDLGRSHRKRRRRRSILLKRRARKKLALDSSAVPQFECDLCQKSFFTSHSLTKHNATLSHVSKLSELEYLKSRGSAKSREENNLSVEVKDIATESTKNKESAKTKSNNDEWIKTQFIANDNCSNSATYTIEYQTHTQLVLPCVNSNDTVNVAPNLCANEVIKQTPLSEMQDTQKKAIVGGSGTVLPIAIDKHMASPNTSVFAQFSVMTNTASKLITKAALKGYESVNMPIDAQLENSSTNSNIEKLGSTSSLFENPNHVDINPNHATNNKFLPLNIDCVTIHLNSGSASAYLGGDRAKNNDTHSSTSSKTIMHSSIIKAAVDEHNKVPVSKIVIPDRPFKNIGKEEKQTITFEKPKTSVSLISNIDNLSGCGFSHRDDLDFICLANDQDSSLRDIGDRTSKNCSSDSSSCDTVKTMEHKSLIMGRIFKKVTSKCVNVIQPSYVPEHTNKIDLNHVFDELRGNQKATTKKSDNFKHNQTDEVNDTVPCKKVCQSSNENKNFQPTVTALPVNVEEKLDEGQRKSKRRCATSRSRKFVEIWSSDEYEEFLTTKDVIALIEEKEKREKRKKGKNNSLQQNPSSGANVTTLRSGAESKESTYFSSKKSKKDPDSDLKEVFDSLEEARNTNKSQFEMKPRNIRSRKKEQSTPSNFPKGSHSANNKALAMRNDKNRLHLKVNLEKKCVKKKPEVNSKQKNCRLPSAASANKNEKKRANPNRQREKSEKLYSWSSTDEDDFALLKNSQCPQFENEEQFEKHGWIVGDSHKKLVTLLATAKGSNKGRSKKKCF